jgi:DNA/RNA-binding domain of Phe-tRNA-synthetase-like protein
LGEPKVTQHLRSGEIAYADDSKVICRYWNWHDCHETRLRADTIETLLIFDLVERADASLDDQFEIVRSDMIRAFGKSVVGEALLAPRRNTSAEVELR